MAERSERVPDEGPAALPADAVHPLTREAWRAWLEANHGAVSRPMSVAV